MSYICLQDHCALYGKSQKIILDVHNFYTGDINLNFLDLPFWMLDTDGRVYIQSEHLWPPELNLDYFDELARAYADVIHAGEEDSPCNDCGEPLKIIKTCNGKVTN